MLPGEARLHLETHLENLALVMRSAASMEQFLSRLERTEDGFVMRVDGLEVSLALDTALRVLLVHCVQPVVHDELVTEAEGGQGPSPMS